MLYSNYYTRQKILYTENGVEYSYDLTQCIFGMIVLFYYMKKGTPFGVP